MIPKVTVAIPSLNQARYLQHSLDSIYEQNISMEVCVADGGSSDNTLQILELNRNKLYWYQSKIDNGQSNAVNIAVSKGSAPYIYWLNSDDEIVNGALEKMVLFLEENPEVPAVYGKATYIDAQGKKKGEYFTQKLSKKNLSRRCVVCQPTVLIRRSVWDRLGGLDESLSMSMDYDFWWRILLAYEEFGYLDQYLAKSRLHAETKTSRFKRTHYKESMLIVKKYTNQMPWIWYMKYPLAISYDFVKKILFNLSVSKLKVNMNR